MAERTNLACFGWREFKRGRLETCCPFQGRLGSNWQSRFRPVMKIPTPALIYSVIRLQPTGNSIGNVGSCTPFANEISVSSSSIGIKSFGTPCHYGGVRRKLSPIVLTRVGRFCAFGEHSTKVGRRFNSHLDIINRKSTWSDSVTLKDSDNRRWI